MPTKEQIEEHFTDLWNTASDYISIESPAVMGRNDDTYLELHDYTRTLLEQKAGDKVSDKLRNLESTIQQQVGKYTGNELLKIAKNAVNKSITDLFGRSI